MPRPSSSSPSTPASAPASCQGRHLVCELYGARRLNDVDHLTEVLRRTARACGATVLEAHLHPFEENEGVTGVLLLAESHISIHTWPEHSYAAVDLFMCGDCDPRDGLSVLEETLAPDTMQHATFERGRPWSGRDS